MKLISILLFWVIFQSSFADEKFISIDGPNCLNGALVASGILPYHRYTSNSEMLVKLKSPMCKKIKNKSRQSGDIGIILDLGPYATPHIISHAFVFLDDSHSYEKRGYGKTEPYQTVATMTILSDYEVDDIEGSAVEFYRCDNWRTFYSNHKKHLSKKVEAALNDTLKLEEMLHLLIKSDNGNFSFVKEQIFKIAGQMNSLSMSPNEIIIGEDIAARLASISSQLSVLGDPALRSITQKWEYEEKGIDAIFNLLSEMAIR